MHSRSALVIALLLVCACLAEADVSGQSGAGLTASAVEEGILDAQPRSLSTVVFQIHNASDSPRRFNPEVVLPAGWRLVSPLPRMELKPGAADVVLVTFAIPQAALAGVYEVLLEIRREDSSELLSSAASRLRVASVLGLDLQVSEQPQLVIAGNSYKSTFVLTNLSNVALECKLHLDSGRSFRYVLEAENLSLVAGQSKEVVVEVHTPEDLPHPTRHVLKLEASASDHPDLNAQAATTVEILPFSTTESTWHKFPLTLEVEGAYDTASEQGGPLSSAIALSGRGTLDDRGRHNLALDIEPPPLSAAEYAPAEGSYSLEYWNERGGLAVGDGRYSLSSLTTGTVNGRGARGYLRAGDFELGGLWVGESAGLYLNREFGRENSVELAWLCNPGSASGALFGIDGFFRPYDLINIDFEAAVGTRGSKNYAYSLQLDGRHPRFSYILDILRAGKNFAGAVKDVESFAGLATVNPLEDLRFAGRFQLERHNLDMDASAQSILSNRQLGLGVNWKLLAGIDLSASWNGTFRRDYDPAVPLDSRDDAVMLQAGWTRRNLRIRLATDFYTRRDFVTQAEWRKQLVGFSANYKPTRNLNLDAVVRVDTGLEEPGLADTRSHFKLGAYYTYLKRTTFYAIGDIDYYFHSALSGSDNLSLGVRHQFPGGTRLDLSGGFTLNHDPDLYNTVNVSVAATTPLNLPIHRRSDIGSVRGKIINRETGAGMAGVILSVNGSSTITDGDGEFYLPAEPVGTTYLELNPLGIDPGLISIQSMPMTVQVQRHRQTYVEIGMTRGAELTGRIRRYEVDPAGADMLDPNAPPEYKPKAGVAGVVVEASGPGGARRAITDENGTFVFSTLAPGTWNVKVVENRIPDGYVLEDSTLTVELSPGESELIELAVKPKRRIMRILEEREIGD